ncbi:hypothetical protein Tco_0272127, partial [Tanacetum coccineum]
KAATEVAGCCGGCNIDCRLLRRLPHRLKAVVKASIKAATKAARLLRRLRGYCEGCEATAKAARLLQRLLGYCEGYEATAKAARLLRRLPGYCKDCQATTKATRILRRLLGYCEGCQAIAKAARLLLRLPSYYEGCQATMKATRLLRRSKQSLLAHMEAEAVVEVMAEIIGRDASTCKLQTRRGTSEMERAFEDKGVGSSLASDGNTRKQSEGYVINNHKDHLGKFVEKADDGYLLGYSFVSKAFRVFNTKRQQTKETYHITFDESPDATKFSKPLIDNINIAENERYPLDKYLHPYRLLKDQNGQTDQNDQTAQTDEILNDNLSKHYNHNNDKQIIDNLPNTENIQISEHSSSLNVEDTSVQYTISIPNPPLPIPSVVTPAPQDRWS